MIRPLVGAALVVFATSSARAQFNLKSNEDGAKFVPVSGTPLTLLFAAESFDGLFTRESHSAELRELNVYSFGDAAAVTEVDQSLCESKAAAIVEDFPSDDKRVATTDLLEDRTRKFCLISIVNRRAKSMHKVRLFGAGFIRGRLHVFEAVFAKTASPAEIQEFGYFLLSLK